MKLGEVGQRPRQFNPIQRYKDNTDLLVMRVGAASQRRRYRPSDFVTQTLPQDAKYVPPMAHFVGGS